MTTYTISVTATKDLGSVPTPRRRLNPDYDDDPTPSFSIDEEEVGAHIRSSIEDSLQHGQLLSLNKADKLVNAFADGVAIEVDTNVRVDLPERDTTDHEGLHTTVNDTMDFEGEVTVIISAGTPAPFVALNVGRDEMQLIIEEAIENLGLTHESTTLSPALDQALNQVQQQRDKAIEAGYTIIPAVIPDYLSRYNAPPIPCKTGHLTVTALDQFAIPLYANDPGVFLTDDFISVPVAQLQQHLGHATLDIRSDRKRPAIPFPHYPQYGATPEQATYNTAQAILKAMTAHAGHPALIGFVANSLNSVADTAPARLAVLGSMLSQTQLLPFTAMQKVFAHLGEAVDPDAPAALCQHALDVMTAGSENLPVAIGALLQARSQLPHWQFNETLKNAITPVQDNTSSTPAYTPT